MDRCEGHQHFALDEESERVVGVTVPVYRWLYRTVVAE
ncbi:DUF5988 family protein [Actinopolyspora erythraea]